MQISPHSSPETNNNMPLVIVQRSVLKLFKNFRPSSPKRKKRHPSRLSIAIITYLYYLPKYIYILYLMLGAMHDITTKIMNKTTIDNNGKNNNGENYRIIIKHPFAVVNRSRNNG